MITILVKLAVSKVCACIAQWEEAEQSHLSTPFRHDLLEGNART